MRRSVDKKKTTTTWPYSLTKRGKKTPSEVVSSPPPPQFPASCCLTTAHRPATAPSRSTATPPSPPGTEQGAAADPAQGRPQPPPRAAFAAVALLQNPLLGACSGCPEWAYLTAKNKLYRGFANLSLRPRIYPLSRSLSLCPLCIWILPLPTLWADAKSQGNQCCYMKELLYVCLNCSVLFK